MEKKHDDDDDDEMIIVDSRGEMARYFTLLSGLLLILIRYLCECRVFIEEVLVVY
jgi:hypothetical protein